MTERENLLAKLAPQGLAVTTEKRGSLVARGLAAIHSINKQLLTLIVEADAEQLFKQGMRYRYGEDGTQADDDKAREYFTKASELDHAEAQFELFHLTIEGGGDENWNDVVQWLERSAHLGFGPAQYTYATSFGLPEDEHEELIEKAFAWYEKRALAGDAEKQFEFADIHLRGGNVMRYPALLKANRVDGLRWLKAAAKQDHRVACRRLGYEYLKTKVTERTTTQGIYWLTHAADLGDAVACVDLAELYLCGRLGGLNNRGPISGVRLRGIHYYYLCGRSGGFYSREPQPKLVEIDQQAAVYWYERGIQLGSSQAAYKLGYLYLDGSHLPQNCALAEKWLIQAAIEGDDCAQILLGVEYKSGKCLTQNNELSMHWFKKVVGKGREPELYHLARMLETGPDFDKAIFLYKQAACDGNGHKLSQQRLDELGIDWKTA